MTSTQALNYQHGLLGTKCIVDLTSPGERTALAILNAYRDTSVHYYQEVSEDILYVQAQAAVTLFGDLLQRFFGKRLGDIMPARVLPISTRPPRDIQLLITSELEQIDRLLQAGQRRGNQAAARLRSVLALAAGTREQYEVVSEQELQKAITRRRKGQEWPVILPEIAQLRLDTQGEGIALEYRLTKNADLAVRVAEEGEPVFGTVIKQEINIWDKFNLSSDDLAGKLGLSRPKTLALILEFKIRDDPECFRALRRNAQTFRAYSKKALDRLRDELDRGADVEGIWAKHRPQLAPGRRRKQHH